MKTIITLIVAGAVAMGTMKVNSEGHGDKYCAKIRDGKKVVMHEGTQITADVTLDNGTVIRTDGTVVLQNGTRRTLQEGECIDKGGVISGEKDKKDKDKERDKKDNKNSPK
jgi:hypothetical protein